MSPKREEIDGDPRELLFRFEVEMERLRHAGVPFEDSHRVPQTETRAGQVIIDELHLRLLSLLA